MSEGTILPPGGDPMEMVRNIDLVALCESDRVRAMERMDARFESRQYDSLRYEWDGRFSGYGDAADIQPGWYVPLRMRKPSVRLELERLIVTRFSAMVLGEDHFPAVSVDDDEDSEDFVRALMDESSLRSKLMEARDKGGASGTVCLSFAFVKGKPKIQVHRGRHMHPLEWEDRYDLTLGTVLKAYAYKQKVWVDGKQREKRFFFARLWTRTHEVVWDPIPEEQAKDGSWVDGIRSVAVEHRCGECPVYWVQNLPESDEEDGFSDYQGLPENFDEINRLISATTKGTVANVDPTLVIKEDPGTAGVVRKGSENAIFAKGGADYLELTGTSVSTARDLAKDLIRWCLDVAGVVVVDPEKISGAARSAAAMRLIYQPMINQCDKLRTQYGQRAIVPLLRGMLRAAKQLESGTGEQIHTEDGRLVEVRPSVQLEPRVQVSMEGETDLEAAEDGRLPEKKKVIKKTERKPGESERITLKWPPYFQMTQQDIQFLVDAAIKAKGTLVSQKTSTQAVAGVFGVTDVEQEIMDIEVQKQVEALRFPGPEEEPFGAGKQASGSETEE